MGASYFSFLKDPVFKTMCLCSQQQQVPLCYENVDPGLQLISVRPYQRPHSHFNKHRELTSPHEQIADLNKTLLHLSTRCCHGNARLSQK